MKRPLESYSILTFRIVCEVATIVGVLLYKKKELNSPRDRAEQEEKTRGKKKIRPILMLSICACALFDKWRILMHALITHNYFSYEDKKQQHKQTNCFSLPLSSNDGEKTVFQCIVHMFLWAL